MSIEVQIKLIVMSILFGFIFMIIYSFFNEFFYKSKLRIIYELPLFLLSTLIYFYLLYKINTGILNIYLPLFILIGILIYQLFYSKYFLYIYSFLHKKIILFFHKHAIIRKKIKRKKKYGKKRISRSLRMEQKQSNNDVITWSIDFINSIHR